jgi:hypothetical protein
MSLSPDNNKLIVSTNTEITSLDLKAVPLNQKSFGTGLYTNYKANN